MFQPDLPPQHSYSSNILLSVMQGIKQSKHFTLVRRTLLPRGLDTFHLRFLLTRVAIYSATKTSPVYVFLKR